MIAMKELPNRSIACLDMRSFYASCAAVFEGLDVMETPIAIVGNKERKGGVILAASPPLKAQYGIQTGMRLFDMPKDDSILLIEPKMETYLKISMEVTKLLSRYVPKSAIHTYSIDESFIDLSGTEQLWGSPQQTVQRIQEEIYHQFQLPSAAGMGPNMLLAKLALDLEAKKTNFAYWTYDDVPDKLWPISPLSKMWGIGSQLEKTLHAMGILSVGDLAHASLEKLEKKFGVMGNQLYFHAHGIDLSELGAPMLEGQVSYGKGQVLYRDYTSEKAVLTVLLEMCEDVARRAREAQKVGKTVHVSVMYSKHSTESGFSRSRTMNEATNDTLLIYDMCKQIFQRYYTGAAVRRLAISLTNLSADDSMQLSLFQVNKWRRRQLALTMDGLRRRYGSTAVLRAVSYTPDGTAVERAKLLGGHIK